MESDEDNKPKGRGSTGKITRVRTPGRANQPLQCAWMPLLHCFDVRDSRACASWCATLLGLPVHEAPLHTERRRAYAAATWSEFRSALPPAASAAHLS
jgi:hypothetical protein